MLRNPAHRVAALLGVLILLLAGIDRLVEHHPAFGVDATPAFAAWYGIASATMAIGLATLWGRRFRRSETSAEEEGRDD